VKTKSSEFQIILESKLAGPMSGDEEMPAARIFPQAPQPDLMATLSSLFFNHGPVKQNISSTTYFQKKEKQKSKPENVVTEICINAKPKTKIKRSRTFDQIKALNTFGKFGEAELSDFSTDEEIKMAYRRLAKKYHPDAGAKNDLNFKIISAAYKKLIF
jgi:hypothetical protein